MTHKLQKLFFDNLEELVTNYSSTKGGEWEAYLVQMAQAYDLPFAEVVRVVQIATAWADEERRWDIYRV